MAPHLAGLAEAATYERFGAAVIDVKCDVLEFLISARREGKTVVGYGAPAKGNTLLNTCGITTKELDYIIDNTPFKQNKIAPGSWIPVRPPEMLLKEQPDYALLLAWNFAPEIIKRETEFQKRGGRFIVPIPEPKIVDFC